MPIINSKLNATGDPKCKSPHSKDRLATVLPNEVKTNRKKHVETHVRLIQPILEAKENSDL